MIGDQSPLLGLRQVPNVPRPEVPPQPRPGDIDPPTTPSRFNRSLLAPSVRGFEIAENQSPIPQDRFFYSFNYFEDVNKTLNRVFEPPITNLRIYRHVFGAEKTIFDGRGSLGLRLPLNTIRADPRERLLAGEGGSSTALGNLTVFGKFIHAQNQRTGDLISVGLAITPPTGPA
ncbi:MAG TPA: hypothetical protein VF590_07635, partial [Isosphaeraceae bacterium]